MITYVINLINYALFGGCLHKWREWEKPRPFGYSLFQETSCIKCGKTKQSYVGFNLND